MPFESNLLSCSDTQSSVACVDRPNESLANDGRYRIVRELGAGAMGTVYLADDLRLGRQVALKIPDFAPPHEDEMRERFEREARVAASLHHPNICTVHDVGSIAGVPYLTMTYIPGTTLADLAGSDERMPPEMTACLIRKIALALAVAHDAGIVHRDLKPANILIDKSGEPYLTDFGLAWRLEADNAGLTRLGASPGTPAYMAPEVWDRQPESRSTAADIYSLGVILYELLAGEPPFRGSMSEVGAQVRAAAPAELDSIDARLAAICATAMSRDPSARFVSARSMAEALGEYLRVTVEQETVAAKPMAPKPTFSRTPWFAFAAMAALAVAAFSFRPTNNADNSAVKPDDATPDIQLPTVSAARTPTAMKLDILYQRANENTDHRLLGARTTPFRTDDKVRVRVELPRPAYVYLYWYDVDGNPHRLWPEDPNHQQKIASAWSPAQRPGVDEQLWHRVGGMPGLELILAGASDQPMTAAELSAFERQRPDIRSVAGRSKQWPLAVTNIADAAVQTRAPVEQVASPAGTLHLFDEGYERLLGQRFAAVSGTFFEYRQ